MFSAGWALEGPHSYLAALDGVISLNSPRYPNVLGVQRDALQYLDSAGRYERGLELAGDLQEELASFLGQDHEITRDARMWVARFLDRLGRGDEAAQLDGVENGVISIVHRDGMARTHVEIYAAWGRGDKVREYEAMIAAMHDGR